MSGRQKLEVRLTENSIMKEELALLDGSNVVFKLLGSVLVKQELGEARATVGKRLDYITAEIKRYESQFRDLGQQSEQQRQTFAQLSRSFRLPRQQRQGSWEGLTLSWGVGEGEE
ncbi:prefoldin subunit 6-like [Cervus elaphus]|uniref:prefoldin subunit 6-like n=1 Tax=Cervus elaphus TaxID=9860 RepID=UPI001CC2DA30|nr:prefoldin subunit 6-like [Cervus elaphus]